MTAQRVTDRQVMPDQRAARRARRRLAAIAGLVLLLGLLPAGTGLAAASVRPAASRRALCGTQRSSPAEIEHVMLENQSYRDVIGSPYAPFQNRLARQCGVATAMFAATHNSAADYLAVSAGQYPPASTSGCNTVGPCATTADNLYHQLGRSGLTWRGYLERMRSPCQGHSGGGYGYKLGHNPIVFYTDIGRHACDADDLPVPSLAVRAGAFWLALENQTLPSLSWGSPDRADDGEGPGTGAAQELAADKWLRAFLPSWPRRLPIAGAARLCW
jgi:hypothetical protein